VVTHQISAAITAQQPCPHCGQARRHKDQHTIVLGTLFGALRLPSPPDRDEHHGHGPARTTRQ